MTTPGLRTDQIGTAIVAAPGDTVIMMNAAGPGGGVQSNSASYVDIDASLEKTFNVAIAGWYDIVLIHQIFNTSTGCDGRLKLIVDEGDYNGFPEQVLLDDTGYNTFFNCVNNRPGNTHYMGRLYLQVGEHKVIPQWKFIAGAGFLRADGATRFNITATLNSGSGAGGVIVNQKILAADFTITQQTGEPPSAWEDIDNGGGDALTVQITTQENEWVSLEFSGYIFASTAAWCNHFLGFDIDGTMEKWAESGYNHNGFMAWCLTHVQQLSTGLHTIKLQGARITGQQNVVLQGGSKDGAQLTVKQYRGGLVPIQENGTAKLSKPQAFNFKGGVTVTDNSGVADIDIGWKKVVDLDFSTEANQTLSSDTTYSIGGKTWTKINSANDAVAMAVVNGTGLVIQPASTSDHYISTRTLPAIICPITSLIPNIDMGTRFRITVYISDGNWVAQYDCSEVCLENPSTNTFLSIRKMYIAGSIKVVSLHLYNNSALGEILNSDINSSDVFQMDVVSGLATLDTIWSHGLYSTGLPAQSALIPYAMRGATGATMHNLYSGATAVVGAISSWNLLLGALRAASGTSLSTTIARIKIEVKY